MFPTYINGKDGKPVSPSLSKKRIQNEWLRYLKELQKSQKIDNK